MAKAYDEAATAIEKAEKKAVKKGRTLQSDVGDLLRFTPGDRLADVDTGSTPGFRGKKADGRALLRADAGRLADLQERLFASGTGGATDAVLLILQAMDTAGKGGIVRHVVGAVDPQGVHLHAFKAPTAQEQNHSFLWRVRRQLPAAGLIGVFDRSHYEDVLVQRVRSMAPPEVIEKRYGQINDFEEKIVAGGTRVVKVMLHISPDEQKDRLAERLERPDKYWKYRPGDLDDRSLWPEFGEAYQIALDRTSTEAAPWFVVPADHKWYARIAVQQLLIDAVTGIDPQWPAADVDVEAEKKRLAGL